MPKRKSNKQKKLSSPPSPIPAHPPLRTRFSPKTLFQRFRRLFSPPLLASWLEECPGTFYDRLFSPLITLWYFTSQGLGHIHSLNQVVADARLGGADSLCSRGKRLSQKLKSLASTSFSNARQRLPLALLQRALGHSSQQIRSWCDQPTWEGWNVILLDGSTVRLRSLGDIPKHFIPHRNNVGSSYWCLMRVIVGFCLNTGVAVTTTMGACTLSEQALCLPLLAQLGPKSLIVGDRNFGIFSVAQAVVDASAHAVVRLTTSRAAKLVRANRGSLAQWRDREVRWTPSRHDQANSQSSHPFLDGRLLAFSLRRRGHRSQKLYLFTTLTDTQKYPATALLDLYGRRWQVELSLRFVKSEMELGALNCKSAEMAKKEWVAGLLAYNLIRSLMVASASTAGISVWDLSFTFAREILIKWLPSLLQRGSRSPIRWRDLLAIVAKCRLPKRRKPRPVEPRAKRHVREDVPPLRGSRAAARRKLRAKSENKC